MGEAAVIKAELQCPICFEPAANAIETDCCHHIFCGECFLRKLNGTCPICLHAPVTVSESHIARRIIGNLPANCPHPACPVQGITRSTLKDHKQICEFRPKRFAAVTTPLNDWLAEVRSRNLTKKTETILEPSRVEEPPRNTEIAEGWLIALADDSGGRDTIVGQSNSQPAAEPAALAHDFCAGIGVGNAVMDVQAIADYWMDKTTLFKNQKHYCGRGDVLNCACCDGICGFVGDGCNCANCMAVDICKRGLPSGFLVNCRGNTCERGPSGNFYCLDSLRGDLEQQDESDEAYCCPEANCKACKKVDQQANTMYAVLW